MGVEIEKKYKITNLPENIESYPSHKIEQGYLNRNPVIRIRRSDDDYYMTYKGKGLMEREEYNLPITEEAYRHLGSKVDGHIIRKRRYLIPLEGNLTAELDLFDYPEGLVMAEVEFDSLSDAEAFVPPAWFGQEVTNDKAYHNVNMAYGNDK